MTEIDNIAVSHRRADYEISLIIEFYKPEMGV